MIISPTFDCKKLGSIIHVEATFVKKYFSAQDQVHLLMVTVIYIGNDFFP